MQYAAWPKKIVNFCSLAILYSIRVWNHFLHKFESSRDALHLQDDVDWALANRRNQMFKSSIFKLSLAAVIYVWCERNRIIV